MRAIVVTCLILTAMLAIACVARAEVRVDEGSAKHTPWSGYWWPIAKGELLQGPLRKHDALAKRQAHQWERQHNPPGENVPDWYGY